MTRIAKNLKADRRTNATINVKVLKTKLCLRYNNIKITLPATEAVRMADLLSKGVAIQHDRRHRD